MTKLIERNTTIPTARAEVFSTAADNQPRSRSTCCRASARWPADNKSLGKFQLTGIPPAPRGVPQIEVTFDIDANGSSTSRRRKGHRQGAEDRDQGRLGLSEEEIKNMVSDAESHAEEDRKARELAEARNNGENAAYQAERQLTDLADQVDGDSKERIEARSRRFARRSSRGSGAINAKTEELQSAFHAVSEAMYQRARSRPRGRCRGQGAWTNGEQAWLHLLRRTSWTPR